MRNNTQTANYSGVILTGVIAFAALIVLIILHSILGYWFEGVSSKEVAIQMHAGQPVAVVGPGNYSDVQFFASIQRIDASELPFTAADPEVLTQDLQRIGLNIQGTVRRPGQAQADVLLTNWSRFSTFYLDNQALLGKDASGCSTDKTGATTCTSAAQPGLMQNLSLQAMKVCVGDLPFSKAVVGSARDDLRNCIDKELGTLALGYSLTVNNIVVPVITLNPAVQKSLDDITNARFQQQVAVQTGVTASANADAELAKQQGAIRVSAGQVQEQAKQDAITAGLNQQALLAQRAVIEQQKANDLFSAQQDLAIQQQQAQVAAQKAVTTNAAEANLAAIYQSNPAYANQRAVEAQASAFSKADKIIVPAGTNPNVIIGSGTQQPVIQTPTR